jgi:hypothetical protein
MAAVRENDREAVHPNDDRRREETGSNCKQIAVPEPHGSVDDRRKKVYVLYRRR